MSGIKDWMIWDQAYHDDEERRRRIHHRGFRSKWMCNRDGRACLWRTERCSFDSFVLSTSDEVNSNKNTSSLFCWIKSILWIKTNKLALGEYLFIKSMEFRKMFQSTYFDPFRILIFIHQNSYCWRQIQRSRARHYWRLPDFACWMFLVRIGPDYREWIMHLRESSNIPSAIPNVQC